MNDLMRVNQGLASRFATQVVFRHLPPQRCLMLLQQCLGQLGIQISNMDFGFLNGSRKALVETLFADLAATPSWGNGRDVQTLAKIVMGNVFKSCALKGNTAGGLTVSFEELVPIMRHMLDEKRKRRQSGSGLCNEVRLV
jgi:hypothetical protein